MLLLLAYPLRKRVHAFQRWGKAKWWLWFTWPWESAGLC